MKQIILIINLLFFIILSSNILGQEKSIIAGIADDSNYAHIIYNPSLDINLNESFDFDIDNDANSDLEIVSYFFNCLDRPPFCYDYWTSEIVSKNSNLYFAKLSSVLYPFFLGDTINLYDNWANSGRNILSLEVPYEPMANITIWQNSDSSFVGFKQIYPNNDTLYGWIKLECSDSHTLHIYEFYSPYYRLVDSTFLSIETSFDSNVEVYPNPVNDYIRIDYNSSNGKVIRIYDINGVVLINIEEPSKLIDTQKLKPGIYFIEVLTNEGKRYSSKFLKL